MTELIRFERIDDTIHRHQATGVELVWSESHCTWTVMTPTRGDRSAVNWGVFGNWRKAKACARKAVEHHRANPREGA